MVKQFNSTIDGLISKLVQTTDYNMIGIDYFHGKMFNGFGPQIKNSENILNIGFTALG